MPKLKKINCKKLISIKKSQIDRAIMPLINFMTFHIHGYMSFYQVVTG